MKIKLLVAALLVLAIAGAAYATVPNNDEAQARAVVSRFQDAVLASDGSAACALMSDRAIAGIADTSRELARYFANADPDQDCAHYLATWDDQPEAPAIGRLTVDGDTAHARLTRALHGIGDKVALRKIDGEWRVDLSTGGGWDDAFAPPQACLEGWNEAAGSGLITTWSWTDYAPEEVWAQLIESPTGCSMIVQTPLEFLSFREVDGWSQSGPSVPSDPGTGMRNVWLATDGTATPASEDLPAGELDCGEMTLPGASEPVVVTGAHLDCETIRAYVAAFAEDGTLPPGWDENMCGASSLSCEHGDQYFRADPLSEISSGSGA